MNMAINSIANWLWQAPFDMKNSKVLHFQDKILLYKYPELNEIMEIGDSIDNLPHLTFVKSDNFNRQEGTYLEVCDFHNLQSPTKCALVSRPIYSIAAYSKGFVVGSTKNIIFYDWKGEVIKEVRV
jgi:hypothetical protein